MGHPKKSEGVMEIPIDVIPNILLRLPSKDFVRSSCVCKLWRSIVADPSFRKLHVAHHAAAAASSEPEVLLVTETGEPGRSDEASVFNLSSAKALSQVSIPSGYRLAGICNDLLCFALDHDQAPAVVCNPVTGETLQLPKAPPLSQGDDHDLSHIFVLGFSPPTKEYKMFRFSFPRWQRSRDETNHVAVYTLGSGSGGWRQYPYLSRFHPVKSEVSIGIGGIILSGPAPVHIDGNIFVPTANLADKRGHGRAARMLVLDVAAETSRSYRMPYNFDDYHEAWEQMVADAFDLNGQMCFVVYAGFEDHRQTREKIQFWVMRPPSELQGKEEDDDELYWDLRYIFSLDGSFTLNGTRGAWIDREQTLCYRVANYVYKYHKRGRCSSSSNIVVDSLLFDERLELPKSSCHPSYSSDHWLQFSRSSICGGYRPSLLSPLIFALPPSKGEKRKKRPELEHALLRALEVEAWSTPCYKA